MSLLLKLLPLILMFGYGWALWRFSVSRTLAELDRNSRPLAEPGLVPVLDRLAEAADVARIPVNLYEVDLVNGLAAPDGRIFLTRGFLQKYRAGDITAEELASVVAHEMGHVALGHTRRRMIDFTGQNAVRVMLMSVLGRLIPGFGPFLANLLTSLVAARLSRGDEYQADRWASALLIRAGIGTAPQTSLFRKLAGMTRGSATMPAWLLSHPRTEDRIRAIEANARRWGVTGPDRDAGDAGS